MIEKILNYRPMRITYSLTSFLIVNLILVALAYENGKTALIAVSVFVLLNALIYNGVLNGRRFCKWLAYVMHTIALCIGISLLENPDMLYKELGIIIAILSLAALILLFGMRSLVWFKACVYARKGQLKKAKEALDSLGAQFTLTDTQKQLYQLTARSIPKSLVIGKWYFLLFFVYFVIQGIFFSATNSLRPIILVVNILPPLIYLSIFFAILYQVVRLIDVFYSFLLFGFCIAIFNLIVHGVHFFMTTSHGGDFNFFQSLVTHIILTTIALYILGNKKARLWCQAKRNLLRSSK